MLLEVKPTQQHVYMYVQPANDPASTSDDDWSTSEAAKRFEYFGYNFESVCTQQQQKHTPPVHMDSEFCGIVEANLGKHRFSYCVLCVYYEKAVYVVNTI